MNSQVEEQNIPTPSPRRSLQAIDVRDGDFRRAAFGDQISHCYKAPVKNVDVYGGDLSGATLGDQTITTTTVHKYYESVGSADAQSSDDHGSFEIKHAIRVYEKDPINADSRVFRGALVSSILDDQAVVVKILPKDTYAEREARMHFHIPSHPNIVHPIFADVFKYRGQSCIYVALELCDPLNLHDFLNKLKKELCPFPAQLMISYAQQTSEGVAFLHRQKIINRDLKPQNILLTTNKTVIKLCDFGLSKLMKCEDGTEHTRINAGTSGWKSPEVLRGDEQISTSADVFSLGLIHYFLLSYGEHAFGNDEIARDLNIRDNTGCRLDKIQIPSHETAILFIIKKQLCPYPHLRPSAEEVRTNFKSFLFNEFLSRLEQGGPSTVKIHAVAEKNNDGDKVGNKSVDEADNPPHRETCVFKKIGENRISFEDDEPIYADGEVLSEQDLSSFLNSIPLHSFHSPAKSNDATGSQRLIDDAFPGHFNTNIQKDAMMNDVMIIKTKSSTADQLYNELRIMKMLTHENIMKVFRQVPGEIGKSFYLELENMSNGNLSGYLFNRGIQYSKILQIATQVASGMAYVASKEIVHRDLRAHNIYIDGNNTCKIGGFHFARELHAGVYFCEEREEIPEKWTDPDFFESFIYTKESDVWSFGMFLVEITTRKYFPYPDLTSGQIRDIYKKGGKLPRLPRVTPRLYEIMLDCWDNIRLERPTFIELEDKLKKLI